MDEQEVKWEEITVRKTTAVVKCVVCFNVNKNEDYGDQRLGSKVLVHCPGCNRARYHEVMERILEVSGLPESQVDVQVDIDAIVEKVTKAVEKKLKMKKAV